LKSFSFTAACEQLVDKLVDLGYTLAPEILLPEDHLKDRSELGEVEKSILYSRLLCAFPIKTLDWISGLKSNPTPPCWHTITINSESSPFKTDECFLGAPSREEALALILYMLDESTAKLDHVITDDDMRIELYGQTGCLARIEKVKFIQLSETDVKRAHKAVKRLQINDPSYVYEKKLKGLFGYTSIKCDSPEIEALKERKGCLDITCNNLVASLHEIVIMASKEPVKPSDTEKILASIFGFDSWNHLKALKKLHARSLDKPYYTCRDDFEQALPTQVEFYNNCPEGLVGYGRLLARHERKSCSVSEGLSFSLSNFTAASYSERLKSGMPYKESSGIVLSEMKEMKASDKYCSLATQMINSGDLEKSLLDYSLIGVPEEKRLVSILERFSDQEGGALIIDDWVYWVSRNEYAPMFYACRVSELGSNTSHEIGSFLHKALIVKKENGGYWLATDWDEEPVHHLPGINDSNFRELITTLLKGNSDQYKPWIEELYF